jgi:transcriptional regulator with XRE-family HTH domain
VLETWGDHIKRKRLELGLSQLETGRRIGVTEQSITIWELHHSKPRVQYIPKIIDFLGYAPYVATDSFPEWLFLRRHAVGLTQKVLAKLLGLDASTIASWERGGHRPVKGSKERVQVYFIVCRSGFAHKVPKKSLTVDQSSKLGEFFNS